MLWRKKNENLKRVRPWKRNSNPDKILHNDSPLAQEKQVEETQEESQMKKIEIKYLDIADIKPYKNNPRKNDKAVDIVEKSIKEFGFKNPIVLDKNNEIIVGHTRLRAAKKIGLTEVPVIFAEELTPEQVKAFRIMDNKSSEIAKWDFDLLKVEFESMQNLEFTGFTEAEIDKILDPIDKISMGNIEPKHKIELGDVYGLGAYIIKNGKEIEVEIIK